MQTSRLFHFADANLASSLAGGDFHGLAPPSLETEGFVHLSFAAQLAGTLDVHFAKASAVLLIEIEPTGLGEALRLEPSRDDALFPHLYRPLLASDVKRWWRLSNDGSGWQLPEEVLS